MLTPPNCLLPLFEEAFELEQVVVVVFVVSVCVYMYERTRGCGSETEQGMHGRGVEGGGEMM